MVYWQVHMTSKKGQTSVTVSMNFNIREIQIVFRKEESHRQYDKENQRFVIYLDFESLTRLLKHRIL